MTDDHEPSTWRVILRELPRPRVAVVMLVVVVVAIGVRGHAVAVARGWPAPVYNIADPTPDMPYIPPWEWTANEWLLPWK